MGDLQIVAERPIHKPLALHPPQRRAQEPGRHVRDEPLDPQHPLEPPRVCGTEVPVGSQRLLGGQPPRDHVFKLSPGREPKVESSPDSFRRQWQAVPGRVADEEHPVLGRTADAVWDPVALIADGVAVEV